VGTSQDENEIMADQNRVDVFFGNDGSSSTKAPYGGHNGKLRPNVWSSDDSAIAYRIVQQYDQDHTLAPSSILQSQRQGDTTTATSATPKIRRPSTMSTVSCRNDNHIDIYVDDDTDDPPPPTLRKIPKIPKRIHFIWLGSKPIPRYPDLDTMILPSSTSTSTTTATADDDDDDDSDADAINKDDEPQKQWNGTMRSWNIHHPSSNGWSLQLWTEATLQQFHNQLTTTTTSMMTNTAPSCINSNIPSSSLSSSSSSSSLATTIHAIYDYAISIQNYGMASDIARLELLYEYGGVYVDVDYYCVGNLEDLLLDSSLSSSSSSLSSSSMQTEIEFFCGASNTGCVEINNGLIGCRRGHGLIEDMMKEIAGWWSTSRFTHPSLSNYQDNDDDDEYDTKKKERFATKSGSTTITTKTTTAISPITSMLGSFLDTDSLASFQKAAATAKNDDDGRQQRNYLTAMEVIEHTGPGLLTRMIFKRFRDSTLSSSSSLVSSLVVFPSTTFHPLPNVERSRLKVDVEDETESERYARILREYVVVGETKAVHLWGCSWL